MKIKYPALLVATIAMIFISLGLKAQVYEQDYLLNMLPDIQVNPAGVSASGASLFLAVLGKCSQLNA